MKNHNALHVFIFCFWNGLRRFSRVRLVGQPQRSGGFLTCVVGRDLI
jgi:hypothetical protein